MEVFYDKNVTLKVKSVSEKNSRFKVLVSDTFKVFYAIFPKKIKEVIKRENNLRFSIRSGFDDFCRSAGAGESVFR